MTFLPVFLFGGKDVERTIITSRQNEQVRWARRLQQKKYRDQEASFYLEGVRVVEEALATDLVRSLFFSERLLTTPRGKGLLEQAQKLDIPRWECTEQVLSELTDTVNSQGVVAIVHKPTWPMKTQGVLLVADEIQDPGNMGTLLRTAVGAGVSGLLVVDGSVDLYNPKVLRASMGAIFHLPHWFFSRDAALELLATSGSTLVVADLVDAKDYWDVAYPQNLAVVIGNEARGVHPEFRDRANLRVKIPLIGPVESLNASVAAGVLLYEILRQNGFV